jgi:hypothetical protein
VTLPPGRTALLLSHLRDNMALLEQTIDAARQTRERSQRLRQMRPTTTLRSVTLTASFLASP